MVPDRTRSDGCGQDVLGDEVGRLMCRFPQAGGGYPAMGGALDTEDRADMLSPFGPGQGAGGVEHLDQTGFIARTAVLASVGVAVERRVGLTDLLHPVVQ